MLTSSSTSGQLTRRRCTGGRATTLLTRQGCMRSPNRGNVQLCQKCAEVVSDRSVPAARRADGARCRLTLSAAAATGDFFRTSSMETVLQVRPGRTLCVAWAFAALAGAVHVATVVYKQQVAGEFAWASRDIYWMSPLSNFVYFSAVALALVAFARVAPKGVRQSTAEGILAALGALALLLLAPGIWQYASLLLAMGFGVQWARWSRRHGMRLVTPFAVTLGVVGVLTFSGGLTLRTMRLRAEARAERLLPAASADAPNILIIVWDTVRAASVSLLGYERPTTPRLERLAQSGVVFDWAFAP